MTEANLAGLRHPIWEQLYDFTDEWNVPNMSPAELDLMVHRLAANRADLTRVITFNYTIYVPPACH